MTAIFNVIGQWMAGLRAIAKAIAPWTLGFPVLMFVAVGAIALPRQQNGAGESCPRGAIVLHADSSIQVAVENARAGAAFCLKNGEYRIQAVRPKQGQSFHGEGQTILNGSRLLKTFSREGRYWVASGQEQHGRRHGECTKRAPACGLPEGVFIDDEPLVQVLSKQDVQTGRFYFDHGIGRIYLADDPAGRKVEATVAAFAFESTAGNVLIENLTIEKYASVAQKGAIQAQDAAGWIVENCEVRLNSGAGIAIGSGSRVRGSDIHHNGQIGITGAGRGLLVENNRIWANNLHGFSPGWEAGGVKVALGDGVIFRRNYVYDNLGPGLWCDINCRDVLYEGNVVERNSGAGIFHEISFSAVIRDNLVRHNGIADSSWFWGSDILIAASQDVEVYGNTLTVSPEKCGIMLIDQSRPIEGARKDDTKSSGKYLTRNNKIHDNETTFEGTACAGGTSDAELGDENYAVITDGNNLLDRNIYRIPHTSGPARFVWGHAIFDWNGLRGKGVEPNGRLEVY